jgi:hypothetical protein
MDNDKKFSDFINISSVAQLAESYMGEQKERLYYGCCMQ